MKQLENSELESVELPEQPDDDAKEKFLGNEELDNQEWVEGIKDAVREEGGDVESDEFTELIEMAAALRGDEDAQEKATELLDEFGAKAHEVSEAITNDLQRVVMDDQDYKYFQKMMKKTPWNGENMELLLKAYSFVEEARNQARERGVNDCIFLSGIQLYGVIQQFNKIEGKGIDRAQRFFNDLYRPFATAFMRFKEIKERNDRVIKQYEEELNETIASLGDDEENEEGDEALESSGLKKVED